MLQQFFEKSGFLLLIHEGLSKDSRTIVYVGVLKVRRYCNQEEIKGNLPGDLVEVMD